MANPEELTSELASLRSDWHELERASGALPGGLHIQGLMHIAMARLDDRISLLERNIALAHSHQPPRLGAAA